MAFWMREKKPGLASAVATPLVRISSALIMVANLRFGETNFGEASFRTAGLGVVVVGEGLMCEFEISNRKKESRGRICSLLSAGDAMRMEKKFATI